MQLFAQVRTLHQRHKREYRNMKLILAQLKLLLVCVCVLWYILYIAESLFIILSDNCHLSLPAATPPRV